jgi:uncharacterized RDD family membrane protein YckC
VTASQPRREPPASVPAGALRRFAALVYDLLLLLAVLFLGTVALLPFTGGEAITPQDSGPWEYAYRSYLAALALGFFGVSWTRSGQTLGMMAWKIRLERRDGTRLDWLCSARRLAIGAAIVLAAVTGVWLLRRPAGSAAWLAGLALQLPALFNYLWMRRGAAGATLHDRLSGCRVVRL